MALTDFFRINFPYGIKRTSSGGWVAFNREYQPLGHNKKNPDFDINNEKMLLSLPVDTKYKELTDSKLEKLAWGVEGVHRGDDGKIKTIFFYNDGSNPTNDSKYWNEYFDKIKQLSSLKTEN